MASTRAKPTLPLLLALVTVVIPGPGDAQVSIHPREAFLPQGGSVQVNCSSSCKEDLSLGLETQWLKDELESGPNWKLFELSEIGEDSSPLCFENCGTVQSSASATITVYYLPATIPKLDTPDLLEVGTQQKLFCSLEGLFPASEARIYLELGGQMPTQESTNSSDSVSATALVEVTEEFDRTLPLRCVLELADQILELTL